LEKKFFKKKIIIFLDRHFFKFGLEIIMRNYIFCYIFWWSFFLNIWIFFEFFYSLFLPDSVKNFLFLWFRYLVFFLKLFFIYIIIISWIRQHLFFKNFILYFSKRKKNIFWLLFYSILQKFEVFFNRFVVKKIK
jgi:hypothetical protein